jgi:hypothetical protein
MASASLRDELLSRAERALTDPTAQIYARTADGKIGAFHVRSMASQPAGVLELAWMPAAAVAAQPIVIIGVCDSRKEESEIWAALKTLSSKVHYKAHRPPPQLPWVGVCIRPDLFEHAEATEMLQDVICAVAFTWLDLRDGARKLVSAAAGAR